MKIGQKIRDLRQRAGISQETLAQALSISPQAVSRWETCAAAPDISLLPAIAHYFGVSIDLLFSYDASHTEQELEAFLDRYYALLQESEEQAGALLREELERYPGQEALRLLQCFHLRQPEDLEAKTALCLELSRSQNPTVRTEALIVLAAAYHKSGDPGRMRDILDRLPECDETKLSLSARFLSGAEAMLCAQRQKNASLSTLFEMQLRIAALYQEAGDQESAGQSRLVAEQLLKALQEDPPFRFPKGNQPGSAYLRLAREYPQLCQAQ